MNSKCNEIQNRIFDYIDDLQDAREKAEFEAHIKSCGECSAEYAKLKNLIAELNSLPAEPVPDDFNESLSKKLSEIEISPKPFRFFNFRRGFSAVAAGILFFLLIRTGYFENFNQIKTAYVDDTQLVMVEDENNPSEVSKINEAPITVTPAPTKAPAAEQRNEKSSDRKKNDAVIIEDKNNSQISDEKEASSKQVIAESPSPATEQVPQQHPSEDLNIAFRSFIPENNESDIFSDNTEANEKMSILSSPVPSAGFSASSHDTDLPVYVNVTATVENYEAVLKIMKENFNAFATEDGIFLELDNEQFKLVMDLLVEYGAKVIQEEASQPLTANKIIIKAK